MCVIFSHDEGGAAPCGSHVSLRGAAIVPLSETAWSGQVRMLIVAVVVVGGGLSSSVSHRECWSPCIFVLYLISKAIVRSIRTSELLDVADATFFRAHNSLKSPAR